MRRMGLTLLAGIVALAMLGLPRTCPGQVDAWQGEVSIPTYPWQEDVNPKFWVLEDSPKLSTTVHGAITYPYPMQDYLLRTKTDRSYKALFLENEYLKVTCLPELGGRIHSVLDKTTGEQMFHLNQVVKPGMIGMRGAWIAGGVEWNFGPQVHTVSVLDPVDALTGKNPDGSAFIELSNQEKIFRTRWKVRLTLHPGQALLDEAISIANPTDGVHPFYFWNCASFPNGKGTRFIYPMSLGVDHYSNLNDNNENTRKYLLRAAAINPDFVFFSRLEALDVLRYSLAKNPSDAHAHLHSGNLYAALARDDEALPHWRRAVQLTPDLSVVGLAAVTPAGFLMPKASTAKLSRLALPIRPSTAILALS